MSQPGKVFRADLTIRDRGELGEVTNQATVWIDAEQRKARAELRRDGDLFMVTAVDNWDVATFDSIANKVATVTVPEDRRGNVRNPAFSILAPSLVAAYQAGQINAEADVTTTLGEQVAGREAVKLSLAVRVSQEIQVPVPPSGPPSGPGAQPQEPQTRTETITINQEYALYIDPTAGLPLQESVRGTDGDGKELSVRVASFENPTLLDRSAVPADTLSIQAVQRMQATLEQQVERARRVSYPLYWLGMELPRAFTDAKGQRQPGLVLNDVIVIDRPNAPRRVVLQYGTRDEPTVPYVVLIQQPRSDWEQFLQQAQGRLWFQTDNVERRPVQVPGGQGTLYQLQLPPLPQAPAGASGGARPAGSPASGSGGSGAAGPPPNLPPLLLVQVSAGDGMTLIDTPPLFVAEGRQGNPFLDPQQIAALAGALARLN